MTGRCIGSIPAELCQNRPDPFTVSGLFLLYRLFDFKHFKQLPECVLPVKAGVGKITFFIVPL